MAAKSTEELLKAYSKNKKRCEKVIFDGVDGKDVYNITAPFQDEGQMVIAGRVERRDSEDSKVMFFIEREGKWIPREDTEVYNLQDPFVAKVDGQLIFGGVKTYPHPTVQGALGYKTIFYRGSKIRELKEFAQGPEMMKDIRLVKLLDGTIGVFTRPQGKIGGRGKIGFIRINSLDDLDENIINSATIIENQFIDKEWGGTNELHLLEDGLVGVLGHIACFDEEGNRHYYSMAFKFEPYTQKASEIKIIATRGELLEGCFKRTDIADVIFSGGIVRKLGGEAELYLGVSDAEAQKVIINDPFL